MVKLADLPVELVTFETRQKKLRKAATPATDVIKQKPEPEAVTSRVQQKPKGARLVTMETRQKLKEAETIDEKNIQWEARDGEHCVVVNRYWLLRLLRKRMCDPHFYFSHFYKDMLNGLKDSEFETFVRFCLTAVGTYPGRSETFIKLKAKLKDSEIEFPLPESFLRDYSSTFVSQNL